MQALRTAEGLAETCLTSTSERTTATKARQTMPAQRTKVLLIQFLLWGEAAPQVLRISARQCRDWRGGCPGRGEGGCAEEGGGETRGERDGGGGWRRKSPQTPPRGRRKKQPTARAGPDA